MLGLSLITNECVGLSEEDMKRTDFPNHKEVEEEAAKVSPFVQQAVANFVGKIAVSNDDEFPRSVLFTTTYSRARVAATKSSASYCSAAAGAAAEEIPAKARQTNRLATLGLAALAGLVVAFKAFTAKK